MVNVIGVRFQQNGKMYYFNADSHTPGVGEFVIVDTVRGQDLGEVIMGVHPLEEEQVKTNLQKMIRPATDADIQHARNNRARESEAFSICQSKIAEHQLEMKLVSVECAFDNSKILFYFTANGRVDFRALVKDLASVFKTRIELRQIGVRDEARMLGGLGPCGRPICCGTFLSDFQPVSIKMAKEQNLSLNPTKISGICGRLMCCLKYEQDHYEQTRKKMPRVGREVSTPDGYGTVVDQNVVKETVSVRIMKGDDSEIREYPLEKVARLDGRGNIPAGAPEETVADADPVQPMDEAADSFGEELEEIAETGDEPAPVIAEEEKEPRNQPADRKKPKDSRPRDGQRNKNSRSRSRTAQSREAEEAAPPRVLGQVVRRENPAKARNAAARKTEPAAEENPASPPVKQPEKKEEPKGGNKAPQPSKKNSNWAAAVEQALRGIDEKDG